MEQRDMWAVIQGTWQVILNPNDIRLRLSHTVDGQPVTDTFGLQALIPAGTEALTPSGRMRLTHQGSVEADVLAQPISWAPSPPEYICVAHAVLACVGGYN